MNVHMCQTQLARAEAYEIAATHQQYIVPTNGKPLRGLIQDHVIMGVNLTKRDTFLERGMVMQLLELAQIELKPGEKIKPLPVPAVLKPRQLWTGKQVITHLLAHLHPDAISLTCEHGTKTAASAWTGTYGGKVDPDDGKVIVRHGELLCGVLDKSAFGASEFGLVHCVYELLGGEATGRFLTQLGRLFTGCNHIFGMTCGIEDLLLTPDADAGRRELVAKGASLGLAGVRAFLGMSAPDENAAPAKLRESVAARLKGHVGGPGGDLGGAMLDGSVKEKLMPLSSEIAARCLPSGQRVPFPRNNFAMMTFTGAKGGNVNFSQISALLGQQELEGGASPSPLGVHRSVLRTV